MRVLVSDASILIDLAKWSLLNELFKLPFEFVVPDALYDDELIDLGEIDREYLKELGLRIESLDAEGMARAISLQAVQPKLTLHDCLAVTLALTNDWTLLTGDKRMRSVATSRAVQVHGVLWVIEQLAAHNIAGYGALINTLREMLDDSRTFLPPNEIKALLLRLINTQR